MTSESERRGAFICQQCYATSFDTEPEAVKHENAYGHSTVWSPAVGKAIAATMKLWATPGVCRSCLRRRPVFSIFRRGGGTYRRGGRSYRSSICGECAVDLVDARGTDRFDSVQLAKIAEQERR